MYPSDKNPTYGIFVKNVVEQLQKNGIVVSKKVVMDNHGGTYLHKALKYFKFYFSIVSSCFFSKYDFIYTHHMSFTAIPLIFCKLFIKNPLIANAHGNDVIPTNFLKKSLIPFARLMSHQAQLVIVPSVFFQQETCKTYRLPAEKTYVYPSGGINFDIFTKTNTKLAKEKLGFSEIEFVITYISRIDKGKGWDIFLRALRMVLEVVEVKAVIVGWGDEKKQFQKMLVDLDLTASTKIIYSIPHAQLDRIYNASDIFIFPSLLIESLGLVGLEAMATGTPVIASKIGGIQDYLRNGKNGYFFEPGNSEELKERIIQYYNLPEIEKGKMSRCAIETAKKFDSKVCDRDLSNKFRKMINSSFSEK